MDIENLMKQRDSSMIGLDDTRVMRERGSISRSALSNMYDSNNILKSNLDDLSQNWNNGKNLTSISNNALNYSKTDERYKDNNIDSMSNDLESFEAAGIKSNQGSNTQYKNVSDIDNEDSFQKINKRQFLTNSEINGNSQMPKLKKLMKGNTQVYNNSFKKPIELKSTKIKHKISRSTNKKSEDSSFLVSKKNLNQNIHGNGQDESFLKEHMNISKIPISHGNKFIFFKVSR